MKTPVTSKSLRQHFTYNWWVYLLIALLAFGLVDLLYTVTAYRSPRDKTIGFYVYGYVNDTGMSAYMDNIRETEMSDMEEMSSVMLAMDDTYGPMQLMTYLSAGEGDVYMLPREQFLNYSMSGSMVPQSTEKGLEWYKKAADLGYARSMYALGYAFQCGQGVEINLQEALRWYEKAALAGYRSAFTVWQQFK